jgi:ribosomal protein L40E
MKCQKCQAENPDGIKFCKECGADGWIEKYETELATLL